LLFSSRSSRPSFDRREPMIVTHLFIAGIAITIFLGVMNMHRGK
jgi:hypothetical protein